MKINKDMVFKGLGVLGTVFTIAGGILSAKHGERTMKQTVAEEVAKALSEQAKES